MPTPLELARKNPSSLKGKILLGARRVFARRGFHGATTRAIAKDVGIDVSTLYYHWGSKETLFEGVLEDLQWNFEERLRQWVHSTKDEPLERCFDLAVASFGSFFLNDDLVRVAMFSFFDSEFGGKGWAVKSQRQLIETLRLFVGKRFGTDSFPADFDMAVLGFIAQTLTLVASRRTLAQVLDIDPNGREYRDLVIGTVRRSIETFAASFQCEKQAFTVGHQAKPC